MLKREGFEHPILIPVPSKDGLVTAGTFRTLAMIEEASAAIRDPFEIVPALRFTEELKPAHAGGSRGRAAVRPYLQVVYQPPPGPIVLIDDIVTTGGTLLAAYDALTAAGRSPQCAIICGHTVSDSLLSAFGHHEKKIDTDPEAVGF